METKIVLDNLVIIFKDLKNKDQTWKNTVCDKAFNRLLDSLVV